MSEWKKEKLGDYVEVLSGFAFKSKDFTSEGVPVIKIKNISPPNVSLEDLSYVPMTIVTQNPRYILSRGDVLIAMTGSHINQIASVVGRVGRIRYDVLSVLNQRVGKIVNKDDKKSSLDFVYYYLSQYEVKVELAQKAGGAANQANISPKDIKDLMFPCPPVETQHRIATILSRYESLIENYQKQIKLLEEAAQRFYKEWFIDLRFPGHENTKIVDGLPEGWEVKSIIDVYNFKYGKILPTKDFVKDGTIPVYGASKQIGRYSKANCFEPKVLIGSRGNAGFVHRTIEDETYVTNNSFIVEPKKEFRYLRLPYIYESLKVMDFVAICTGAAQPQLTLNSIASLKYIIPSDRIITDYCDVSVLFFKKIAMSYKQLRLLTEARDRLLPKLMSGEIEI